MQHAHPCLPHSAFVMQPLLNGGPHAAKNAADTSHAARITAVKAAPPAQVVQSAEPAATVTLAPGHARLLRASRASVLRIEEGRVWLTFTQRANHAAANGPTGDCFLSKGDSVRLATGQPVVIEPFGPQPAAAYSWQTASAWPLEAPGVLQTLADVRIARGGGAWMRWCEVLSWFKIVK